MVAPPLHKTPEMPHTADYYTVNKSKPLVRVSRIDIIYPLSPLHHNDVRRRWFTGPHVKVDIDLGWVKARIDQDITTEAHTFQAYWELTPQSIRVRFSDMRGEDHRQILDDIQWYIEDFMRKKREELGGTVFCAPPEVKWKDIELEHYDSIGKKWIKKGSSHRDKVPWDLNPRTVAYADQSGQDAQPGEADLGTSSPEEKDLQLIEREQREAGMHNQLYGKRAYSQASVNMDNLGILYNRVDSLIEVMDKIERIEERLVEHRQDDQLSSIKEKLERLEQLQQTPPIQGRKDKYIPEDRNTSWGYQ